MAKGNAEKDYLKVDGYDYLSLKDTVKGHTEGLVRVNERVDVIDKRVDENEREIEPLHSILKVLGWIGAAIVSTIVIFVITQILNRLK